jgi:phosphatidate phosphatase
MMPLLSSLNLNASKLGDNLVFICFAIFLVKIYYFSTPFVRGFDCDDSSITRPYQQLTVNLATIILFSTIIPCTIIFLTETLRFEREPRPRLKKFAFTSILNLTLTIFCKFTVGRLRPHFMSICRPNVNCTALKIQGSSYVLNEDYECLNTNRREVSQARQSFFSGHASISMNAAIYTIVYIQNNYPKSLLKSLIQFAVLLTGLYPGITQVNNYWHHYDDVLTGYLCGVTCALLNYQFV